jgi:hypothetical protein
MPWTTFPGGGGSGGGGIAVETDPIALPLIALKADIVHTHVAADVAESASKKFVSETEKNTWNAKQSPLGFTPENTSNKGATNGYAPLVNGTVPANNLPSYVDEVLEYATYANFPVTGLAEKIYVDISLNQMYRWSGSGYVGISSAGTADEALKLHTARSIAVAGAVSGSGVFDGSANITINTTIGAHTHVKANITDFTHYHSIADVSSLGGELALKAALTHTHQEDDINIGNNTANNATLGRHGYVPKLTGNISDVFRGDGTYGAVTGTITGSIDSANVTVVQTNLSEISGANVQAVIDSIDNDLASKSDSGHTHVKANITDFAHVHTIADTTGLQTALNAKASTSVITTNFTALASTDNTIQLAFDKVDDLLTGIETLLAAI